MWARMPLLCHLWPGITPWNVWDLTLSGWLVFVSALEQWEDARRRGSDG